MKQKLYLFIVLCWSITGFAQQFIDAGIKYNVTSAVAPHTVEVIANNYTGNVDIPGTVTYLGTTYSVTQIGSYSFFNRPGLTSVVFPNTLKTINGSAFQKCSNLQNVTFPESLENINGSAFLESTSLTSITIPKSVRNIGSSAFEACTGLTYLKFEGNNALYLNSYSFKNCTSLKTVEFLNSNIKEYGHSFLNCPIENLTVLDEEPSRFFTTIGSIYYYFVTLEKFSNRTNCKLYVPKGSKNRYQVADGWKDYLEIIELNQGKYLIFDGVDDYVNLGNVVGNTSYTKEAWIYPFNISGFQNIISSSNCPLWLDNGILKAGNMTFANVQAPTAIPAATWTHVAVTYDKPTTTMKLYVNGALVSTSTNTANYTDPQVTNLGMFGGGNFFRGNIEDVRIWDKSLTATEISQSKDCELAGTETNLVAYYKLNQGVFNNTSPYMLREVTTAYDSTVNAHHGTLINFGTVSFNPGFQSVALGTKSQEPTALAQTFCGAKTVADLAANGTGTLKWYADRENTTPLLATDVLVTGTYYVASSNNTTCESNRTAVDVTVNPDTLPIFDAVAAINAGETLAPLPTTSTNGITGTWSPALNNSTTTTYTFTRDVPSCNPTVVTMTINVRPTPLYVAIPSASFEQELIYNGIDSEGTLDGRILYADVNGVTELFLQNSIDITDLSGIKEFINLEKLVCYGTSITSLDVSGMLKLKELRCGGPGWVSGVIEYGDLTSLNLNDAANLETLSCSYSKVNDLKISGATKLKTLNCTDNRLTSLDLSGLTNLQEVYCGYNQLTNLNAKGLKNLTNLECDHNQITNINLNEISSSLLYLYCNNNNLSSLNISELTSLTELKCENNANLSCVTVNDLAAATSNSLWTKDAITNWSENCFPVFNGTQGPDWTNASNWTPSIVPDLGSSVTIPTDKVALVLASTEIANATIYGDVSLLGGSLSLKGTSSLNNGAQIKLNSHDLILNNSTGSGARIATTKSNKNAINNTMSTAPLTGNETSFVVCNGTGEIVVKNLTNSVTLPIGVEYYDSTNETIVQKYNPTTIANSGTVDDISVGLNPSVVRTYNGTTPETYFTEKAVDVTWNISEAIPGGSILDITLQWDATQELTNFVADGTVRMGHYNGTSWDLLTGTLSGSGPYAFKATGITNLSPFSILNDTALGIETNLLSNAFSVYPNPTNGIITIDLNNLNNANLQVIDITGKILLKKSLNDTTNKINIEQLPSGMYFFKINTNEGSATSKVIKQ